MGLKYYILLIVIFAMHETNGQELISEIRLDSISIFFETGSSTVKNPNSIVKRINGLGKVGNGRIKLIGYTDSVGSLESNQHLASKRLQSVGQVIKRSNAKGFVLDTLNLNEIHGGSSDNKSLYRRVDIIVYETKTNYSLNTPIPLKIQFKSATDLVLPSSNDALKQLLFVMKLDKTVIIQLNGHVCCTPDHPLSLNRAKRVKSFLVKNGIDEKRVTCFGFSNTKKLVVENSPENQMINMRVEVVFVK